MMALLLMWMVSSPLHTVQTEARVTNVLPSGGHAVVALENSHVGLLDPGSGKLLTVKVPLQPGFKTQAAGATIIAYDRNDVLALQHEGNSLKIKWRQTFVAAPKQSDPSDEPRIAALDASPDTLAVADTRGNFALLNVSDGKVAWKTEIPSGRELLVAAGARCGAVVWTEEHDTHAHAVDIYLEPIRENRRTCGMLGVVEIGMTTDGVVFVTPDRMGLITFDGYLKRARPAKQTRVGCVHVMGDESFGSLVWSVGVKGLCVTPLPEATPFVVHTPKHNWDALWVNDTGMFASNDTQLARWVAANAIKRYPADGRPLHPLANDKGVVAVVRTDKNDRLQRWAEDGTPGDATPLPGSSKTTQYAWAGKRLLGYDGKTIRIYNGEGS